MSLQSRTKSNNSQVVKPQFAIQLILNRPLLPPPPNSLNNMKVKTYST